MVVGCYRRVNTTTTFKYSGLIAAFAEDSRGNPHTLSFLRKMTSPKGNSEDEPVWTCRIDACPDAGGFPTADTTLLSIDNTEFGAEVGRSDDIAVIHIIREYDMISAMTSKFYRKSEFYG